jgi:hypothetical protein
MALGQDPGLLREPHVEERRELARYRADYLAASAPLGRTLLAGAAAGFGVYLVPLGVVLGSFLLLRLFDALLAPPARWLFRTLRLGAFRPGQAPPTPLPATAAPVALPTPPAIEPVLDGGGEAWIGAAVLVLFWPVIMLAIGAVVAFVYRARRAQRWPELSHTPLEVPILWEVVLFYALTTVAALVAGIGSFVAVGLNVVFAWAGYLVWRWLYDRLLDRLVPAALRHDADEAVRREQRYRRRHREAG